MKFYSSIGIFLNSANLICRSTDISKCFRGSLRLRDNESRPLIEYGDVIWDNCTQYEKQELDKIQNEAARIATETTKLVSLHSLYDEECWESLECRRNNHKLTLFYKIVHNITPLYLSSLIPQSVCS